MSFLCVCPSVRACVCVCACVCMWTCEAAYRVPCVSRCKPPSSLTTMYSHPLPPLQRVHDGAVHHRRLPRLRRRQRPPADCRSHPRAQRRPRDGHACRHCRLSPGHYRKVVRSGACGLSTKQRAGLACRMHGRAPSLLQSQTVPRSAYTHTPGPDALASHSHIGGAIAPSSRKAAGNLPWPTLPASKGSSSCTMCWWL